MTAASSDRWAYRRTLVALVAVANLVPVFGVQFFDWGVTELLVVYWLECGVALLAGIVKTAPARLVMVPLPDPRWEPLLRARFGMLSVSDGTITCHARNGRAIVAQLLLFGVWLVIGLALLASASPLSGSFDGSIGAVSLVAGSLAIPHLLTTKAYFDAERFDRRAPQQVVRYPHTYLLVTAGLVGVALLWSISEFPPGSWPPALPYVIVGGKIGIELYRHDRGRNGSDRVDERSDPSFYRPSRTAVLSVRGRTGEYAEPPSVTRPSGGPRATARPALSSLIRASPVLGLRNPRLFWLFVLSIGFALLVIGDQPALFPVALGAGVAILAVPILCRVLPRHATLEYEFHDDRLVCYDRWLEEPIWNLPYADVESVSVERGIAARVGGYGTIRLETADDRPARLAYLRDYRELADRLERIIERRRDDR